MQIKAVVLQENLVFFALYLTLQQQTSPTNGNATSGRTANTVIFDRKL